MRTFSCITRQWTIPLVVFTLLAQLLQPVAIAAGNGSTKAGIAPATPAVPDASPAAKDGDFLEDIGKRDAFRKVFVNGDQMKVVHALAPVHFEASPGVWSDIDMTLVPDTGKFAHRTKANAFTVRFTDKANGNQLNVEHKGRSVTFDLPEEAMRLPGKASERAVLATQVKGTKLRYEAANSPVALEYDVGNNGLLENVWLARRGAPSQYAFSFTADGVTPEARPDGSIWFVHNNSVTERAFYIPAPFAEDSRGEQTGARQELRALGENRWQLTVSINPEWLADADRTFPVRIDPELLVDLDGGQHLELNGYGQTWSDKRFLKVEPTYRTAHMQFDLRDFEKYEGYQVASAYLKLSIQQYTGCDAACGATMTISQEKQEWYQSTSTWTQPRWQGTSWTNGGEACMTAPCAPPIQITFDNNYQMGSSNNGPWYYERWFDVTAMARKWLDGSVQNNGFLLHKSDRTLKFVSPTWQCCQTLTSALEINYSAVGAPTVTVDATITATPTATVNSVASLIKTDLYVDGVLAATNKTSTPGILSFNIDPTKFPHGSHQIMARSYTLAGQVADSAMVVAVFGDGGVTPPVNLNVYPRAGGGARLTWAKAVASNPSHNITYTILRSADSGFTTPVTVASGVTGTTYEDTAVTGTPYYKVKAVTSAGVSSVFTPEVQVVAPARPFNLRYQRVSSGAIELRWTASPTSMDDSAVTYQVYRNGALLASNVASTRYRDAGVMAGTTYTYHVLAVNTAGLASPATEIVSATGKGTFAGPDAPDGVRATAERDLILGLSWTPINDSSVTYEIIRYTGNDPFADPVGGVSVATGVAGWFYQDTDPALTEGTQYWYRVRSSNTIGVGPWSEPVGAIAVTVRRTGMDTRQAYLGQQFGPVSAAVNLSTGNLVVSAADSFIGLSGLPLTFQRIYNSQGCTACTAIGNGWRTNHDWRVEETPSGTVVVEPDGTEHRFTRSGTLYQAEAFYYGTLTRDTASGGWRLSLPSLHALEFGPDGKLQKLTERNGNELRYSYDTKERLTAVATYPVIRTLTLSYDEGDRLTMITDAANGITRYTYDTAGRLVGTVNNANETIRYGYDQHNRLTWVQDAAGRRSHAVYGVNGAVSHIVDGLGNATAISTLTAGTTTVSDPLGNSTSYAFNQQGWLTSLTDALGNRTTLELIFLGTTLTKYITTDPRGLITEYMFDSAGRVIQVMERPAATAETQDLSGPGTTTRTQTMTYAPATGDLTEQAVQLADGTLHGSTFTYSYSNSGAYPYRLLSTTAQRFTKSSGGATTLVGGVTTNTYASEPARPGWVIQSRDPNGNLMDLTYNADGTVSSVIKRNIDADLVASGAATTSRDVVQEFTYNQDGQVKDLIDWHLVGTTGNALSHIEYDAAGRLVHTTTADGAREFTMYDSAGLPILQFNVAGQTQIVQADSAYRIVAAVDNEGGITRLGYDANGRNTFQINPLGFTTRITYDALGRASRVTDPNSIAKAWTYDKVGNITAMTTGSAAMLDQNKGYRVTASYYLSNLLRQSKEPLPTEAITAPTGVTLPPTDPGDPTGTTYNVTSYKYNLLGQQVEVTDGNGYKMGYGYDDLDRLSTVTQYMKDTTFVTMYGYDNRGNLTTVTDARGKVSAYRFDGLNRVWREIDGRNVTRVEYRFDPAGNLSQKLEPRNYNGTLYTATADFSYDAVHRLVRTTYGRSSTTVNQYRANNTVFAYDGAGRRVYMWDGYGPNFYLYDAMGRLQEERNLWQDNLYEYDKVSRLTAMTSHLGATKYSYDGGDRLTQVEDPLGNKSTFSYDANYGHRISTALPLGTPNKLVQQDSYYQLSDGRLTNRVKQRTDNKTVSGTTSQVWQATYTYDLVGMIRTFRDSTPLNQTYVYDQGYRLVEADGASGNNSHPNNYYIYDSAGNRTRGGNDNTGGVVNNYNPSGNKGSITQTVDDANRATRVDEVISTSKSIAKVFHYEDNGNVRMEDWQRTGYTPACGLGWPNRLIYTYHDDANRLVARQDIDYTLMTNRENWTTYKYDGDGRRLVQKYQQTDYNCNANPAWTERTSYEYANGEVLNERNVGGVPVWYIRDPNGELLYTLHWRNNQLQPDAYVRDHLGSVRMVLDYQGNIANRHDYDAYGNLTKNSSTLRNSYTFTGYGLDDRNGMYYAKARYYRPDLGRFLTQDTWKGSAWSPWTQNLYAYVGNNPVNYVDPTGHRPVDTGEGTGGSTSSTKKDPPPPPSPKPLQFSIMGEDCNASIMVHDPNSGLSMISPLPSDCRETLVPVTKLVPGPFGTMITKVEFITKKVPSPNGKKGGPDHQAVIASLRDVLLLNGFKVATEVAVRDGANKVIRFIDVVGTKGNQIFAYQVGRLNLDFSPVAREARALQDILTNIGTTPELLGLTERTLKFVPYSFR